MVCLKQVSLLSIALACVVKAEDYIPYDKSKLTTSAIFEQFDYQDLDHSPWKPSTAKKFDEGRHEVVSYVGKWAIEPAKKYPAFSNDKGLVLKLKAAHHAISYKLPQPFDNTDNDLVLQYEIKLQNGLSCGGTYIKLLDLQDNYDNFSTDTPYQVMFGPDRCGSENKIHFILRRENPLNVSDVQEKKLKNSPMSRSGDLTTLYTLILKQNQDFEIRINGEVAKAGNLLRSPHLLEPRLNPPKEIIDENDTKPLDWEDSPRIPDPNVQKPEGYDEKHGLPTIPDPEAVKPENWDELVPVLIEDPDSTAPEYWDEEEDGKWLAKEIPNPKCKELAGCGPWSPPRIPNKEYTGPWIQPMIDNPNYVGEWKPRMIANPHYYEDDKPSNLNKLVGGLGFELWSMSDEILFDNIYLGHSIAEAERIGNLTFKVKYLLEDQHKRANKPKIQNEPVAPPKNFDELLLDKNGNTFKQFYLFLQLFALRQFLDIKDFFYDFLRDPVYQITHRPIKFVLYCVVFVFVFTVICGIGSVLLFMISNGGGGSHTYEILDEPRSNGPKIELLADDEDVNTIETAKLTGVNRSATEAIKK